MKRETIADHFETNKQKPSKFLEAWRDAVILIGPALFKLDCSIETITNRENMRPDFDAFLSAINVLSSGQQVFAIAVYQFFSDSDALKLCEQCDRQPVSVADIAMLDDKHRHIIIRLIESYTGW